MLKVLTRFIIFILLSSSCIGLFAQDEGYSWWNNKHNWDGVTNWMYYLKYAPKYFGPNALPVPEIRNAQIEDRISLETRADLHFSKGDNTQNLFFKLKYPFWEGRLALEIYAVPIEFYKMDTLTRDERVSRDKDGEGYAVGDL